MRRLRVSGLVKFAKRVRQEVAGPVPAARLTALRRQIDGSIQAIERLAREEGMAVQSLPSPSRKAYLFLKGLDLSTVATQESPSARSLTPESVSFRGLQSYFDGLLSRIAQSDDSQSDKLLEEIGTSSGSIESEIKTRGTLPEQLVKSAREMRGWLAYFSQRENLDKYCRTVRRAEPLFREACPWSAARSVPTVIQFRPQQGMYHIRGYSNAILVRLPTPMICFDDRPLRAVAEVAFKKGGDRKLVHDAMGDETYQRIASALEMLGGVVAQTRGVHHDLDVSFGRVNTAYFNGSMSRPRLVWSRTFAARKFGHYDHAHDTVMVNMVLDRKTVPDSTVEFIVYHELLHKHMGVLWQSNRMAAHTPQFRERERQFGQYDEARAVLSKLAAER
jgi:hypothetical protein